MTSSDQSSAAQQAEEEEEELGEREAKRPRSVERALTPLGSRAASPAPGQMQEMAARLKRQDAMMANIMESLRLLQLQNQTAAAGSSHPPPALSGAVEAAPPTPLPVSIASSEDGDAKMEDQQEL